MGLLDKLAVGGVLTLVGGGLVQIFRSVKETQRRKNAPLEFDDRLTEQDFVDIVNAAAARSPRVTQVDIAGLGTTIHVRSNSGLTNWKAKADFHDYGRPTGRYWLSSENSQSPIPKFFADAVQDDIRRRLA
ncbi:hypothetical protein ACI2IP_05045 [Microbacterium sp. NPDC090218]